MNQPETGQAALSQTSAESRQAKPRRPKTPPVTVSPPLTIEEQQTMLVQTAKALLATASPEDLWHIIADASRRVLVAERTAVFLYDAGSVIYPVVEGLSEGYITQMCQLNQLSPTPQLWYPQEPVIINDIYSDPRTELLHKVMAAEGFTAFAVFPLLPPDHELLGVLVVYRDHPRPFTTEDKAAGQMLTHMATLALNNIMLLAETRLSLAREQQLNEIARTLASALDLPTILDHVLRLTANIIEADAGLLGLVIDHQVMMFYPYNIPAHIVLRPAPHGRGVAWEVVQNCETLHIKQYVSHHLAQSKWIEVGVTTLLAAPIVVTDLCLGVLVLFNLNRSPKEFTARQIALVESIGRQAGVAIQHARMYAEANQRSAALRNALNRQAELDDLKNKFIQNVSHELRTPLGIIHGHAELLTLGALGEIQPHQRESVDIISRRVRMLIDMVDDLTAMLSAETQEMRREEINMSLLLYSMLDEYRLQAHKVGVVLKADIADNVPMIKGDITHLRRVLDNLTSNAFKFTPLGGTVTLRLWSDDQQIIIEAADTGIGIPETQLSRIFERFYQVDGGVKRQHGGTGLGLALVKEIVEAHRGHIFVTSKLDVGTTFQIILPVAEP